MVVALISRYVMIAAVRAFALVAVALTGLFSLLEFVEQLAYVGQGRYHVADALAYVLLTAPSRLLQVTPMSMLLGSLLALGSLARNSELTAMLSLGISERRIIGSVLALTLPVVAGLILMAEFVIPPAQQLAQAQRTSALSSSTSSHDDNSFWAQSNHQYLNVQQFLRGNVPIGIDIYAFAADGSIKSIIHADRAFIQPDGIWQLAGVTRRRVNSSIIRIDYLASLSWQSFIPPQQMQFLTLPLTSVPPIALYWHVRGLEKQNQKATRYEHELWTRVSIPVSMIAMIMIAAPFVFGSARAQRIGRNLSLGVGFGIAFALSQQILDHAGTLLDLSPAITALAPSLLVIVLAIYLFRRAHRPRRRRGSLTQPYRGP